MTHVVHITKVTRVAGSETHLLALLSGLGMEAARRYGVRGVPTVIVFDGEGNVVDQKAGIPNRQEVVERVNRLLAQH